MPTVGKAEDLPAETSARMAVRFCKLTYGSRRVQGRLWVGNGRRRLDTSAFARLRCGTQIGIQHFQMHFGDLLPIRPVRIIATGERVDSEAV